MRKWLPTILGFLAGSFYGVYLIGFVKSDEIPRFIGVSVGWLGSFSMKGGSEPAVLSFAILGLILFCGMIGAVAGFVLGFLARVARRLPHGNR